MNKKNMEVMIINRVKELVEKSNLIFPKNTIDFNQITFNFKTKGKAAGKACFQTLTLYFNMILFEDNVNEFMNDTIPHELSHLYQRKMYPCSKPHGREFHYVMSKMGFNPTRCHKMDVSKIKKCKNKPTYNYSCNCGKKFIISSLIHSRIMKGQKRICKSCKTHIFYVSAN